MLEHLSDPSISINTTQYGGVHVTKWPKRMIHRLCFSWLHNSPALNTFWCMALLICNCSVTVWDCEQYSNSAMISKDRVMSPLHIQSVSRKQKQPLNWSKWVNHLIDRYQKASEVKGQACIEVNLQSKRRCSGQLRMYSTSLCIQKFICNNYFYITQVTSTVL